MSVLISIMITGIDCWNVNSIYVRVADFSISITLDAVQLRDAAMWRSYVNIASTTGRAAGSPLGGLLADGLGWRW